MQPVETAAITALICTFVQRCCVSGVVQLLCSAIRMFFIVKDDSVLQILIFSIIISYEFSEIFYTFLFNSTHGFQIDA